MNKFEVRGMDLYYGSFHALKNINIDIPEKEITAFIGPSGCGKSTFLKSLNRMNDLVEGCRISGDIRLDGVDIYKDKMDVNVLRKRVGMVFQKPNPFPMSIYDNIAYGPRTHGIHNKAQLDEIVEKSLRGGGQIDLHIGRDGVLDHVQRNIAHCVKVVQHADGARALRVEVQCDLGNIAGLIGNALNVGDHLERRGHLAQIARDRLLPQEKR